MIVKDSINLNIFTVALYIVCQTMYCIDCAMLLSAEKQRSLALLSTKDKRIAIYENQI